MLKLGELFENFELAKYCLNNYDHDTKTLDDMLDHFRISSNAVYPFSFHGDIRFLRLAPMEERTLDDVTSTVEIIQYLRNQGFPAMEPVPMKNGKYVDSIKTQWGVYVMSCFRGVGGDALEDQEVSLDAVTGYGACLGMLHKYLEDYPLKDSKPNHMDFLQRIRARLTDYHASDVILYELSMVEHELETIPVKKGHYGLIHYDFEPDNVFYEVETEEFGVIDFDDMIQGFYALDLVRVMNSLDDIVSKKDSKNASDAFLKGYRMYMPFGEEDEALFPLMWRLVRLEQYSDILRSISDHNIAAEPDWMTELRQKLMRKLRIIEKNIKAECNFVEGSTVCGA